MHMPAVNISHVHEYMMVSPWLYPAVTEPSVAPAVRAGGVGVPVAGQEPGMAVWDSPTASGFGFHRNLQSDVMNNNSATLSFDAKDL